LLYHSPSQKNEKSIISAARVRRASSSPFFIAITNHIANRPADRSTRQLDIGTPVLYVNRRGGVGEQRRSPSKARDDSRFIVPLTAWRKCTRCMKCSTPCNGPCFIPVGVGWACKSCQVAVRWLALSHIHSLQLGRLDDHGRACCCEPVTVLYRSASHFFLLCCSAVSCHATDVLKRDVFDK
jgi:hypothetical protein